MASFLTTTQISAELENLIKTAQDEITIVSPYLKVNHRLQSFIKDAGQRQIRFKLIYGKSELQPDEWNWIKQLETVETGFVENLHAKCYLNETAAIVTSMNLYEFSQQNNDEMGILATVGADPELYRDICSEVERLERGAEKKWSKGTEEDKSSTSNRRGDRRSGATHQKTETAGFCIRCKSPIDFDPDKPLCGICYGSWVQFKNPTHPEKYCHDCGKEAETTFAKPLRLSCFRAMRRSSSAHQ